MGGGGGKGSRDGTGARREADPAERLGRDAGFVRVITASGIFPAQI
jgi:hypothetical protein